jgi:hypothetical protein
MISPIAVHEAGHATAGWVLGTPAARLTLRPPFCTYADGASLMWRGAVAAARPPRTDRETWRAGGVRSLAGAVAESRFSGLPFRTVLRRSRSDHAMVMAFADGLAAGGDRNAVLRVLAREAQDIIERHWEIVLRLARCLEISRSLDGTEIARIIARAQAAA